MKKFLLPLLLILCGTTMAQPQHPPQLSGPLHLLYRVEETRQLIAQVEREGDIAIKTGHFGRNLSNAAWVPGDRTIFLNFAHPRTQGSIVCSIIFELHNALTDKQFDAYERLVRQGKISKQDYITAIEYIEYVNACSASRMLKKGIQQGIFPSDASWPIAPTFQQHFQIQKMTGHSAVIGYMYDDIIHSKALAKN